MEERIIKIDLPQSGNFSAREKTINEKVLRYMDSVSVAGKKVVKHEVVNKNDKYATVKFTIN